MELDAQIVRVLGRADLDESTAELLRLLAGHKGAANAIRIGGPDGIMQTLNGAGRQWRVGSGEWRGEQPWNERTVKAAVKDLVERFGMQIGASRKPPYGYFFILTAEDREEARRPLRNELKSLARRLRALSSKLEIAREWGQIQVELDREDPQISQISQRGAA